jgi:hypothetical protein
MKFNSTTVSPCNKASVHAHGTKVRSVVFQNRVVVEQRKESRRRQHRRSNALLLGNGAMDEIPVNCNLSSLALPPPSQITPSSSMHNCSPSPSADELDDESVLDCSLQSAKMAGDVSCLSHSVDNSLDFQYECTVESESDAIASRNALHMEIEPASQCTSNKAARITGKVSWCDETCVYIIPNRYSLSLFERELLWYDSLSMEALIRKNIVECMFDSVEGDSLCKAHDDATVHTSTSVSNAHSIIRQPVEMREHSYRRMKDDYHPQQHWKDDYSSLPFRVTEQANSPSLADVNNEQSAIVLMMHQIRLHEITGTMSLGIPPVLTTTPNTTSNQYSLFR